MDRRHRPCAVVGCHGRRCALDQLDVDRCASSPSHRLSTTDVGPLAASRGRHRNWHYVLGAYGSRSRYFFRAGIAWMTISSLGVRIRTTRLEESCLGVESQTKLPNGRLVLGQWLGPLRTSAA
jgi:hypothetical protein